jgi:ribonuclease HI/pterin-4a-carbinolamine dehydratase
MIKIEWQKTSDGLYKKFNFKSFQVALEFINKISADPLGVEHNSRIIINGPSVEILIKTEEDNPKPNLDTQIGILIDKIFNESFSQQPPMTKIGQDEIKIFCDGGSRGNPGPSASGFVIYDPNDQILEEGGEYLGITTNNQAEYRAVLLAIRSASAYEPKKITFFLDSLLVVNQMKGIFKVKNKELWPIHNSISESIKNLKCPVIFNHVLREYNKKADSIVNEILDNN